MPIPIPYDTGTTVDSTEGAASTTTVTVVEEADSATIGEEADTGMTIDGSGVTEDTVEAEIVSGIGDTVLKKAASKTINDEVLQMKAVQEEVQAQLNDPLFAGEMAEEPMTFAGPREAQDQN